MEIVGTIITILRVVDFSVAKMTSLEWSWMIDWYLTSLEILGISKWLQVFFFFNLWNSLQIKVFFVEFFYTYKILFLSFENRFPQIGPCQKNSGEHPKEASTFLFVKRSWCCSLRKKISMVFLEKRFNVFFYWFIHWECCILILFC